MDAVRVGLVIWIAVAGYWALYQGVQRLVSVGTSTPPHGGGYRPDEVGFLAKQPLMDVGA